MARYLLGLEWIVGLEVRSFEAFTTVYCSSVFGGTVVYAVVYELVFIVYVMCKLYN